MYHLMHQAFQDHWGYVGGETFEEWMMALRPHYMEAHSDVMGDSSRGKDEMEAWMKENRARFDAA